VSKYNSLIKANDQPIVYFLALKAMTFENPVSIDGILMALERRLKERSWIVGSFFLEG
jgi:hypothetical protein